MSNKFRLKIITQKKITADLDAYSVTLPGAAGEITVLAGHDMLLCPLKSGSLHYFRELGDAPEDAVAVKVTSGCAEITHKNVNVFLD